MRLTKSASMPGLGLSAATGWAVAAGAVGSAMDAVEAGARTVKAAKADRATMANQRAVGRRPDGRGGIPVMIGTNRAILERCAEVAVPDAALCWTTAR